jgi:hypothetical protein
MELSEYTHGGLMAEKVKPDPQPDLGNASVGKCLTEINVSVIIFIMILKALLVLIYGGLFCMLL